MEEGDQLGSFTSHPSKKMAVTRPNVAAVGPGEMWIGYTFR